ncbi:MAG: DEAD/DEAH box helicase family protein [Aliifodinibius sp.]|nr:DEAD/DEAH box helicase family protein [Fodinibius sp.]NIV09957.1 DEAD/DEAH box helicase family protein [Fodinibius sp.]NIY23487.1 DEAD/DEAH box helicase family protein [Fodinibius sp.]
MLPILATKSKRLSSGHLVEDSQFVRDKFTLKSRYNDEVVLYREMPNGNLLVPRNCCEDTDLDSRSVGVSVTFKSRFNPRPGQETLVEDSSQHLSQGRNHILQAATGVGKTVMGSEIAARLGKKFLIAVPKEDILEQWVSALNIVLGLTSDDIGIIKGDICDVAGKKVVIGLIHSLCKEGRYPSWIYREFGTLIIDECHIIAATTFVKTMWLFPTVSVLGLTATPYRSDGKDFVFYAHIGPVLVKSESLLLTPKILVKESEYVTPRVKKKVVVNGVEEIHEVKMCPPKGKATSLLKTLVSNFRRNNLIASFVKQALSKGRHIIIFTEFKKAHLPHIEDALINAGVPPNKISHYVGGMTKSERESAKVKPVIIATYKMASMATNIPWADTCVLTTPRADVVQIVGRILREYPNKKQPVVFDVVDRDSPVFWGYFKSRKRWYQKVGAEIVYV